MDIRGLLLCGGASIRFGRDKLLEKIDGEPMAMRSARSLRNALPNVLAVTRPGRQELGEILQAAGCEVIETYSALDGLGSSLAAGVKASVAADGWVVMLADMPFIRADTIGAVRAALEIGAAIAAPVDRASGTRGHPVGFRAWFAAELMALTGDEGARSVIQAHRELIRLIEVDDPGIGRDIDRPEDLA